MKGGLTLVRNNEFSLLKSGFFYDTIGTVAGDENGNVDGEFGKVKDGNYYL